MDTYTINTWNNIFIEICTRNGINYIPNQLLWIDNNSINNREIQTKMLLLLGYNKLKFLNENEIIFPSYIETCFSNVFANYNINQPSNIIKDIFEKYGITHSDYLFRCEWFYRDTKLQLKIIKLILMGRSNLINVIEPNFHKHINQLINEHNNQLIN